ncbi:MAG: hypothetical protein EXX96DRAFT_652831 [Benjaminiella poitrasii]|nr:MAG: hypothetical protein EXX96DRAFT_652831 [Benjaminiella poitrasii]
MPVELPKASDEEDTSNRKWQTSNATRHTQTASASSNYSLRRDLLLSNFDRTMIVEKAKFEPTTTEEQPMIPTLKIDVSNIPDMVTIDTENTNSSPTMTTYALTMSPSAPTFSSHANGSTSLLLANPLTVTQSMNDSRKKTGTTNANRTVTNSNKKLKKKSSKTTLHGTASPAEIFHRNLVDAVSNVEDSDENEHYVYPYSGYESSTPNGIHRPLSIRSTPGSLLHDYYYPSNRRKKLLFENKKGGGFREWLRKTLYKKISTQQYHRPSSLLDAEEEEDICSSGGEQHHHQQLQQRPKLRSHVKDHHEPKSSLLTLWKDGFLSQQESQKNSSAAHYQQQPYYYYNQSGRLLGGAHGNNGGGGGYTSDDEDVPLLYNRRQQKRYYLKSNNSNNNKKKCKNTLLRNLVLIFITCLVLLIFIVAYRARPLEDISIGVGRVLSTDKELIFDLKVQAENWNAWTIHVVDADISVFAFSQIVPSNNIIISANDTLKVNLNHIRGVDPAEYLGGLTHFDEPLSIQSNLFNDGPIEAITQVRIKSPGADTSGNERWSRMIRYPYGLVVRGVLKYKPVPFLLGTYPQSAAICNVTQVDPTTGIITNDPNKTICASEDDANIFSHTFVPKIK